MFPQSPGRAGHLLHSLPDDTIGMQFLKYEPHYSHPSFEHESTSVQSNQESLLCELGGVGLSSEIHEHGKTANGSNRLIALQDSFVFHNVPTGKCTCSCSCSTAYGQLLESGVVCGICHAQRPHTRPQVSHCMAPLCHDEHMRKQNAQSSDKGWLQLANEEIERGPVEYEYYVWNAEAQEYVQTDQKTGQKMLEDPQYFQYHYKLVEDTQSGEAHLLPEGPENIGCSESFKTEIPRLRQFVKTNDRCYEQLEDKFESGMLLPTHGTQSLSTRGAIMPPQRQPVSPLSTPIATCLHERQSNPGCCREPWGNASQASFTHNAHKQHPENGSAKGYVSDSQRKVGNLPNGRQKMPQHSLDVVPSNLRLFIPCSRPWEKASASVSNREVRVRHLRHLQRVQSLETEELLRRQMSMDEMAASISRLSKHSSASEVYGSVAAHTSLPKECRISEKRTTRPCLPGGFTGGDRRTRSDPVSRGRYFREKWKSDRFLEQQRHPAFDVKAYDAWLKSSGHLLRARALELQQEEQRLASMLRQERNRRLKRCGY